MTKLRFSHTYVYIYSIYIYTHAKKDLLDVYLSPIVES